MPTLQLFASDLHLSTMQLPWRDCSAESSFQTKERYGVAELRGGEVQVEQQVK